MPGWGPYGRLFLLEKNPSTRGGFFQFMVALCMANTLDIPDEDSKRVKILEEAFEKAESRTAWYFQHLPEDKLGEVDDYLEEAARHLRGDDLDDDNSHRKVIRNCNENYIGLHLN